MKTTRQTKNNEGFTLVETLVAITVLLVSVAGPLSIAAQGLFAARISRDQLTAIYLAQDAIEYIRNVRDGNVLSSGSRNWLLGFGGPCEGQGKGCTVDSPNEKIETCGGGGCLPLKYNDTKGFYGYGSGTDWKTSKFIRTVKVNKLDANREVEIEVTVSWETSGRTRSFVVKENILNWQ